MHLDRLDMDVFFGDQQPVRADTWGGNVPALFDREYVEFEGVDGVMPFLLMPSTAVPRTRAPGDQFTVCNDSGELERYKLVGVQYAEPGLVRVILAAL